MTFVEVYRPHVEYGSISGGKFPVDNTVATAIGLEVYDKGGPTYTPDTFHRVDKKILFFFPWYAVARLEYSEGEA